MLSDSVSEISIFKIFLGGMSPDPLSMACFACCVLCKLLFYYYNNFSWGGYSVLYIMCCSPIYIYILCPSVYFEVSPPPENPRSAPEEYGKIECPWSSKDLVWLGNAPVSHFLALLMLLEYVWVGLPYTSQLLLSYCITTHTIIVFWLWSYTIHDHGLRM